MRSYNCLKRGVHRRRTGRPHESDLLDIRNFGQKSIDEVKIKLHQLGLSLKDSHHLRSRPRSPATTSPPAPGTATPATTWTTDQDYAETEQL